MSSTRFEPVEQSDHSKHGDASVNVNEISSTKGNIPTRWKTMRQAYTKPTYVAAPTTEADLSEKRPLRTKSNDRKSTRLSFLANPVSNFRIPKFAAPWQHELPDSPNAPPTVRNFDRRKQWRRLFVNGFLQWCLTFAIALSQWASLYGFSRPMTLSRGQKYTFNAISTLLSLCLGLAVVSALRSYAKLMSWRFLASKYRDLQDFELIMNCHSQEKVLRLLWAGRESGRFWLNKTQVLCLVSLFLVIGLQINIGLLGLTYSIDSSTNVQWVQGQLALVDLSNVYQSANNYATELADQTGAANYFGLVGQNYILEYRPLGKGDNGKEVIYTADNQSYFYNFVDSNYDPKAETVTQKTSSRWIQTEASCVKLEITAGGYIDENAEHQYLNYTDQYGFHQSLWVDAQTTWTSTYISNSSNQTTCGPRCTELLILDSGGYLQNFNASDPVPQLFACNSTVSKIHNANTCTNETVCTLSDDLGKLLAGAIGWSGTWYTDHDLQYKNYPPGSPWSWDGTLVYDGNDWSNATFRQSQVAQFTAGALAAMDDAGPFIVIDGLSPRPGVALSVEWGYTIPVLCVVPAVQFCVLIIVCIWANGALVKDGSYLAAARMLRPVVDKLEEHGCAMTGDEIARQLGNFKVIYGVQAASGASQSSQYNPATDPQVDWHVGVIAESEGFGHAAEEGWTPASMFPGGRYDGSGYAVQKQRFRKTPSPQKFDEESLEEGSDHETDEKEFLLRRKDY